MKNVFFALALFTFAAISCQKEKNTSAIIRDYGPIAADGCGWMIDIDGAIYKATNLDSAFHKDGLEVKVDYRLVDTDFVCGLAAISYDQIEISKIRE